MGLSIAMLLHKSVLHDSRVRREASSLAAAGHRVSVVELDEHARGSLDGFRRVSAAPRRRLPKPVHRAAFTWSFIRRVVGLRPDVVHAHDAAMLIPALVAARLTGAELVYDSHELATGVPYRRRAWGALVATVERLAVPRASAVITVSDGIAGRLQLRYGLAERPAVVRNVSDLTPPSRPTGALRRAIGIGDAALVLHQGAPAPHRGAEVLIRALADLPGAQLAFLGDSPFRGYTDSLVTLAGHERVRDRVHFLPSAPLEDLLALTADADVGVSLLQDTCENHRLALPNKVFEYVLAGVPVVVSDLPELAALVRAHGIGWTTDPTRPESVGGSVREALARAKDPATRRQLALAAEQLVWSREQHRLLDAYRRLAARAA